MFNSLGDNVAQTTHEGAGCGAGRRLGNSAAASDAARLALAPAGTLRAKMNLSNVLFTTEDAATDKLRGASVDSMHEPAARRGMPVAFVMPATPGDVAEAIHSDT